MADNSKRRDDKRPAAKRQCPLWNEAKLSFGTGHQQERALLEGQINALTKMINSEVRWNPRTAWLADIVVLREYVRATRALLVKCGKLPEGTAANAIVIDD
jgi:hypothetical protein